MMCESKKHESINGKKNRGYIEKIIIGGYLLLLTFVVMMQSPVNIWKINGTPNTDASVFKTVAMYMQRGRMPYRDIFDHKGPLLYIYNWIGNLITPWKGIWVVEFVSLGICVIFLYKIARLVSGKYASCVAVLVTLAPLYEFTDGGNMSEEYALPFIAIAIYIFADYFLNRYITRSRLILCGLSLAAVALLRINMIAAWCVFCIAVLIDGASVKSKKLVQYIFWFSMGALLLTIPIFLWLIAEKAFDAFIKDYILFNFMYVSDEVNSGIYNQYQAFSYFLNNIYVLTDILISGYLLKHEKSVFHVSYCIYIFATLLFLGMSGQTFAHYGMVIIPMLLYPFARVLGMVEKEKNKLVVLGIYLFLLVNLAFPVWLSGVDRMVAVYHDYISCTEEPGNRTDTLGKVTQYIKENTSLDDKITVWGNWNLVYVLSGRLSASLYSYQFPIQQYDSSILNTYFAELQANRPKIIVIQAGMDLGKMENFVVQNYYGLVAEIDGVKIYEKDASK